MIQQGAHEPANKGDPPDGRTDWVLFAGRWYPPAYCYAGGLLLRGSACRQ